MRFRAVGVLVLVTVVLAVSAAQAHPPDNPYDDTVFARISGPGGPRIDLEVVAEGLVSPVKAVTAPGDAGGLYVVDQPGKLWRVDLVTGLKTLVLDVSGRLVPLGVCGPGTFDERGFLGLAFHPNYGLNGKLYTYTSEPVVGMPTFPSTVPPGVAPDHQNVLAEWTARGGVADPASRRELLRVDWPQFNHDGGDLAFGPDRMLYVSMGDGGSADDADGQLFTTAPPNYPPCGEAPTVGHQGDGNAQKLNTPHGKVLRIDVDGRTSANRQYGIPSDNPFVGTAGALGEVYALGFRNPYRFSFDTETGLLFLGDVGQNDLEEVDVVTRGGNYGWNFREGSLFFHINGNDPGFASRKADPTRPIPSGLSDPLAQYDTHHEGHSVIGGFVYHGTRFPQLEDRYVFGEYSRLFLFPFGPDDHGRLLSLSPVPNLAAANHRRVHELRGFPQAIAELGLTAPPHGPEAFPPTMSVLGMGQDTSGEVYVTGNKTGRPFGTDGVVLRIVPAN
jgi:glucose/arabinose dehydrogenase